MSITVFFNTMPRYRRYTKTIIKAPKKKWNFGSVYWQPTGNIQPEGNSVCFGTAFIANSTDTTTPAPAIVKVKHIKVSGQLTVSSAAIQAGDPSPKLFQVVVCYIPQVVARTWASQTTPVQRYNFIGQLLFDHPEWVMTRKVINMEWDGGVPGEKKIKSFSFTSGKLSRNLKSGDAMMFFYLSQYLTDNHMFTTENIYAQITFTNLYN